MADIIDLSKNLYDQNTFAGRASHFYRSVNPLNLFKNTTSAKAVVSQVQENGGKLPSGMSVDQFWEHKYIYDSAYHPSTGELVFLPGRMSFQAPGNCMIASGMMIFYRTPLQAIGGQLVNQAFNSTVNYSNSPRPEFKIQDFIVASGSACTAAFGMNKMASRPNVPALVGRLVPFGAVCVAQMINLPYMRKSEIITGMPLEDEEGNIVGYSPKIGQESIAKVVVSRILMATPTMVLPALLVNALLKEGKLLARKPKLTNPLMVFLIGLSLTCTTPACCAIWPQRDSCSIDKLEPNLREELGLKGISTVHYNKGL